MVLPLTTNKRGVSMLFSKEVQKNFLKEVEKCVLKGEDGYIEAILFACEE